VEKHLSPFQFSQLRCSLPNRSLATGCQLATLPLILFSSSLSELTLQFGVFTSLTTRRFTFAASQVRCDAMGAPRLSGMQKQVLSLYRGFLRAARLKSTEERLQIESIVHAEFRRNAKEVERKNFLYIEYLLRLGKKQLDQLKRPNTVSLSSWKVRNHGS
ncbi:hypothetical protein V2J09_001270, partial [Rumex salicifolius]